MTSSSTELLKEIVSELKGIKLEMSNMSHSMSIMKDKTSIMEMRQSTITGEGTDAIRHMEQWAKGESAQLTDKTIEFCRTRILAAKPDRAVEVCTYSDLFLQKDTRRGHYELIAFYKVVIENEVAFFNKGDEYAQGWIGMLLPEMRKIMSSKDVSLPDLPPVLENMLELALPLDKMNRPFKQIQVSGWMSPEHSKNENLSAEVIAEKVKQLPGKVKKVLKEMSKEKDEDPRVTLMHAAVQFKMMHEKYHEANKIIQKHQAKTENDKKRKAGGDGQQSDDEYFLWSVATEEALGKMMPLLPLAIAEANVIKKQNDFEMAEASLKMVQHERDRKAEAIKENAEETEAIKENDEELKKTEDAEPESGAR